MLFVEDKFFQELKSCCSWEYPFNIHVTQYKIMSFSHICWIIHVTYRNFKVPCWHISFRRTALQVTSFLRQRTDPKSHFKLLMRCCFPKCIVKCWCGFPVLLVKVWCKWTVVLSNQVIDNSFTFLGDICSCPCVTPKLCISFICWLLTLLSAWFLPYPNIANCVVYLRQKLKE